MIATVEVRGNLVTFLLRSCTFPDAINFIGHNYAKTQIKLNLQDKKNKKKKLDCYAKFTQCVMINDCGEAADKTNL